MLTVCIFWIAAGITEKRPIDPAAPHAYTYGTTTTTNGMQLHYLLARPSNLKPQIVNNNLALADYYGINGGFFYQADLLSIAVVNDFPVRRDAGTYGGGQQNVKYARGTLVWDGGLDQLSVQVVSEASALRVSDRSNYWAQGGISMGLAQGEGWKEQAAAEHAPFGDEARLRSAAVYDNDGNIYLIVSRTEGTLAALRDAIIERFGLNGVQDGIFLDGDGSSQLRSREANLRGDGRSVVEMLRLLK
jgi:hypothetical protein